MFQSAPLASPIRRAVPGWLFLSLLSLLLLLSPGVSRAQVGLDVKLTRRSYIVYESIKATVTITNYAGRDLLFQDDGDKPWLDLDIGTGDQNVVMPYDPDLHLRPLLVKAGESVERQIDLSPLYPIREFGAYKVRASIHVPESDRLISSRPTYFQLTDGHTVWRQDVGVPPGTAGGGTMRQLSLLTHQLPDKMLLYVRVRDEENNVVFTTQSLGKMLASGRAPDIQLDRDNQIHVLQEAAPKMYLYTLISIDGQRLDQKVYAAVTQNHPVLRRTATGDVTVHGGEVQANPGLALGQKAAIQAATAAAPKLSDRPMGLPVPRAEKLPQGDVIPRD